MDRIEFSVSFSIPSTSKPREGWNVAKPLFQPHDIPNKESINLESNRLLAKIQLTFDQSTL